MSSLSCRLRRRVMSDVFSAAHISSRSAICSAVAETAAASSSCGDDDCDSSKRSCEVFRHDISSVVSRRLTME